MNKQQTLASIVVLAYNGLEDVTRPCIDSILENTPEGSYELVLVDNASSDGTAAYFESLRAKYRHVTLCLNQHNKGYAGGNNDGMRLAKGDYVVLLNNDTLVPWGWLERLLGLLKTNANIGLVGPVTNSAGNEQRIELAGLNESNYEKVIQPYLKRQSGQWFITERLGFYCVALKREVMDRVGFLDERFGLGMFEDDDYCIRARNAGFALAVIEDCFVYHKGSVSFSKLSVESYRTLFEKNRALFTKLHGTQWTFSDIALGYWEKFNADLSAYRQGINANTLDPAIERMLVRWENFHHLLVQVHGAELSGTPSFGAQESTAVTRAKWKIRWHNFRRNVVHGSWRERRRYVGHLAGRVRQRLWSSGGQNSLHPEVQALLSAIPQPHAEMKVVIFPATIDYSYMTQRPQQMANAFAEAGYFVIYGTLNHVSDQIEVAQQVRQNLYVVNERYFQHLVHLLHAEKTTYFCMWPNNVKHLQYVPYSEIIYDYMDDLVLLDLPKEQVRSDHELMLNKADLITVTASKLFEGLPSQHKKKTVLIPNAVSDEFLVAVNRSTELPGELRDCAGKKIIGYYGAIAEWLDFQLLECVADSLPECVIVLIGPVSPPAESSVVPLSKRENVRILKPRSQFDLIPFLQRFDVCIVPFIKNAITDAVSPVKVYEYMAAGKPVVSTNLSECAAIPFVAIGATNVDFICAVKKELNSTNHADSMKLVAKNNRWMQRHEQVESLINISEFDKCLISEVNTVQQEIAESYSEIENYYANFYREKYAPQEINYWYPALSWISSLDNIDSIIDIGAAYGTLLMYSVHRHQPDNAVICDPVSYFSNKLAEKYSIQLSSIDIERESIDLSRLYDLVIFTEVIEHLNFNPLPTLKKLRSMLRDNGHIVLTTPDSDSWGKTTKYYNSLLEIPVYGGQGVPWIDDHIWQYAKTELDALLSSAGLIVKRFAYAPGSPGSGRHLCYLLGKYGEAVAYK